MKPKNKRGFTLVEIMITVGIIGILATIAYPAAQRARVRSSESTCVNNLRQLEAGKSQYAFEYGADASVVSDLVPTFIKKAPSCPAGGGYTLQGVGVNPTCSLGGGHTL